MDQLYLLVAIKVKKGGKKCIKQLRTTFPVYRELWPHETTELSQMHSSASWDQ